MALFNIISYNKLSTGNISVKIIERSRGELELDFDKKYFARLLTLAKGNRSINKYGSDSGVDPGYISRLLRGLVENAPSAMIIRKLADVALNNVGIQDLLAAAGYLDLGPGENKDDSSNLAKSEQLQQWERVIEEAARYDITPEEALDFIGLLGKSMARIRKNDD